MFDDHLKRWDLTQDGKPIVTHSSILLPVRQGNLPAMLKIARVPEEKLGARLMVWWNGQGAASVLAYEGDALLLSRAMGMASLADLARNGRDSEASRIICSTVAQLHAHRAAAPTWLIPLPQRFEDLWLAASSHGGLFAKAASAAKDLLASPQDEAVLHGDIHHGNILDFDESGWLAIDPKGLVGERGFDYANLFCNPDDQIATAPGRFKQRLDIVAEAASLDRERLIQWVLAYAGLSAAWCMEDGLAPEPPLKIAGLAIAEQGRKF